MFLKTFRSILCPRNVQQCCCVLPQMGNVAFTQCFRQTVLILPGPYPNPSYLPHSVLNRIGVTLLKTNTHMHMHTNCTNPDCMQLYCTLSTDCIAQFLASTPPPLGGPLVHLFFLFLWLLQINEILRDPVSCDMTCPLNPDKDGTVYNN